MSSMKLKVGDRIKIVKGQDYFGRTGVIEYCRTCCKDYRIQFDDIGNNELLRKYINKLVLVDSKLAH